MLSSMVLLWSLLACAPHEEPRLSWMAEARYAGRDIRVLPVLALFDEPELDLVELGTVTWDREMQRRERTEQLGMLPRQVGMALPGEVNVAMGDEWTGRFTVGRYPMGTKPRVSDALRGRGDLDDALEELARGADGHAVLVTWVTQLEGVPVTRIALPGEVVETAVGPVLVDIHDEAYRVRAEIGMALVLPDGEVVLRYGDEFEAVLSSQVGPAEAGRDLARALAAEVATVWPADPRLDGGDALAIAAPRGASVAADIQTAAP
jgi:hypothetical protein